jgi:hypothetical protein
MISGDVLARDDDELGEWKGTGGGEMVSEMSQSPQSRKVFEYF